jgi:hypothetical protein
MTNADGISIGGRAKHILTPHGEFTIFGNDAVMATKDGKRYQIAGAAFVNGKMINLQGKEGVDLLQADQLRKEGLIQMQVTDQTGKKTTITFAGSQLSDWKTGETVYTKANKGYDIGQQMRSTYPITEATPPEERKFGNMQLLPGSTVTVDAGNRVIVDGPFVIPINEYNIHDKTWKRTEQLMTGRLEWVGNPDGSMQLVSGQGSATFEGTRRKEDSGWRVSYATKFVIDPTNGQLLVEKGEMGDDRKRYLNSLSVKGGVTTEGMTAHLTREAAMEAGAPQRETEAGIIMAQTGYEMYTIGKSLIPKPTSSKPEAPSDKVKQGKPKYNPQTSPTTPPVPQPPVPQPPVPQPPVPKSGSSAP